MTGSSKTFCVVPYLNITVSSNGRISPCCISKLQFKTDKNQKYLNEAPLLDFWKSESRKKMIENLESEIQIPECEDCWIEESVGKESKRQRENKKYADRQLKFDSFPTILDLSFGNLCNLKCRICTPYHSSLLMAEETLLPNENKHKINYDPVIIKQSFDYGNDLLWKDINDFLPYAERIELLGGEPFYIKKNWDLIKKCVDDKISKNQILNFSTNGTFFPEDKIPWLNTFKSIEIWLSIDATDEKFEYIRHPAKWVDVYNTIKKFINIRDLYGDKWTIGIQITVSVFNIFDLFETFELLSSLNIPIRTNLVHDQRSINILPDEIKIHIKNKLSVTESKYNQNLWNTIRSEIYDFLDLSTFSQNTLKSFLTDIKLRDSIRKESFENIFPDLHRLLKNYYE